MKTKIVFLCLMLAISSLVRGEAASAAPEMKHYADKEVILSYPEYKLRTKPILPKKTDDQRQMYRIRGDGYDKVTLEQARAILYNNLGEKRRLKK